MWEKRLKKANTYWIELYSENIIGFHIPTFGLLLSILIYSKIYISCFEYAVLFPFPVPILYSVWVLNFFLSKYNFILFIYFLSRRCFIQISLLQEINTPWWHLFPSYLINSIYLVWQQMLVWLNLLIRKGLILNSLNNTWYLVKPNCGIVIYVRIL